MCRFLFLGDSITDCDHLWLPETNGLGNGYVSMLAEKIKAIRPDAEIINKGANGFTTAALRQRLVSFVPASKADMICLLIGINDLGAAIGNAVPSPEDLTAYERKFTQNYEHLLKSLRFLTNARILCIAPFVFPYPQEYLLWIPFIRLMERSITGLTEKYQMECLLMQDILCEAAAPASNAASSAGNYSGRPDCHTFSDPAAYCLITTDGIHLTPYGHRILTDTVWPFLFPK